MRVGDSIIALSSGAVPSGVAVIRLSGPQAGALLAEMAGALPEPRRLKLARFRLDGATLDQGLAAWFPAPHSFTGEDCAELHLHGSPAVVRTLLRNLSARPGVRLAEAGEFTRRAFENGKLDLTEVEGLGDLISAETEGQRRQALARLSGGVSDRIEGWRNVLLDARAEIEARLDFSDEGDVDAQVPPSVISTIGQLQRDLSDAAASLTQGRIIREGLRVALAGAPNAGKSSLLNALAKSDLAIVTDEAGTTRDVREVAIDLEGQLVLLVDMAGLRDTESKAEAEGVRRAEQEIRNADLALWLTAPDVPDLPPPSTEAPLWRVATKSDLGLVSDAYDLALSAQTGAGIADLLERLSSFASEMTGAGEPILISHERDRLALLDAASALNEFTDGASELELAAECLRQASAALERLLGRMDAEMVLDRLFLSFCIGK